MHNLIPIPTTYNARDGEFILQNDAQIFVSPATEETLRVAHFLANALRPATGFALPVRAQTAPESRGNLALVLTEDARMGAEEYALDISPDAIVLRAAKPAGLFYGIQTLRQLFPPALEQQSEQNETWRVPAAEIRDAPRYAWRGTMLDVARHFFKVEIVKQYMDLIAFYKINRLHLHLTDDQGWRIEIKSWDKLATIGGSTGVDGKNPGYYTQEEYRELVAYAAERYITIVPEIDMPAHTNAALASYAELNCDDVARELYTGTEVGFCSLCVNKKITYQFLDDVIRELAALTPGEYLHIGGDEAHSTDKEQYLRFIERVEPIVKKYGKRMIGWEEIAQAEISADTIVQPWFSNHGVRAVQNGSQAIMSPAKKIYLDMQYHNASPLGLNWAAYIEAHDAYDWDPATCTEGISEENILGVEAPLWTETITTLSDIEYMTFPRVTALAEIGWSPQAQRDWESYRARVAAHGTRWQIMGINFYRSPQIDWA